MLRAAGHDPHNVTDRWLSLLAGAGLFCVAILLFHGATTRYAHALGTTLNEYILALLVALICIGLSVYLVATWMADLTWPILIGIAIAAGGAGYGSASVGMPLVVTALSGTPYSSVFTIVGETRNRSSRRRSRDVCTGIIVTHRQFEPAELCGLRTSEDPRLKIGARLTLSGLRSPEGLLVETVALSPP